MRRLLPRGPSDLALQAVVFLGGLFGYELVRGLAAGTGQEPFENARRVIEVERNLHVFVEPAIERFVQRHAEPIMDLAVWIYLNAHLLVTFGALLYIYLRHRDAFGRTRDTLLVAMAIGLAGYALFPTAPPRLLSGYGFSDPVQSATRVSTTHGVASLLVNPYAAIPSMHVCFALVLGRSLAGVVRHRLLRAAWLAYPLLIAAVVVVTGNHLFADVALGALTAVAAGGIARRRRQSPAPALGGIPA